VGEFRERVRRQRRDDEQIGLRQVRVRTLVDRMVRQGGEGFPRHEPLGAGRHDREHLMPGQYQAARQFTRFVGGNPARHAEEDASHPAFAP
jgi:hypothetical protein